jgi:hypothetical protein
MVLDGHKHRLLLVSRRGILIDSARAPLVPQAHVRPLLSHTFSDRAIRHPYDMATTPNLVDLLTRRRRGPLVDRLRVNRGLCHIVASTVDSNRGVHERICTTLTSVSPACRMPFTVTPNETRCSSVCSLWRQ